MADRINEDIRFYLPADPYYYQVDNLPLEDLLSNDKALQQQIDSINAQQGGSTVGRGGFLELQPWVNAALPGTVSVRPGNFIGRSQRSAGGGLLGSSAHRDNDGILEINTPPTEPGAGNEAGTYNVNNPPNWETAPGKYVGRNSVFNFMGGSITIDSFGFDDFQDSLGTTAPLGRLDLIGITTVNGAFDDPYLPGNPGGENVSTGDGYPKLAVVKGAGITSTQNGQRQLVLGEKYITIGTPQEGINDYGRDEKGNVVPNPKFGTIPAPDDVVNVCFSRDDTREGLYAWANRNRNASFFLPLAYIYVPQNHVVGNPIPAEYLHDIRPFFRTAELTLQERQALAAAQNPSVSNPVVTQSQFDGELDTQINWDSTKPNIQQQIDNIVNVSLSNLVKGGFEYRELSHVSANRTYKWTFIAINGIIIGHVRSPGFSGNANPSFNLTNMGYETLNGNGQASVLAFGGPYLGNDMEEGNYWRNMGWDSGSWGENTFAAGSDIVWNWAYRNVAQEGDAQYQFAVLIGKHNQNIPLSNGTLS